MLLAKKTDADAVAVAAADAVVAVVVAVAAVAAAVAAVAAAAVVADGFVAVGPPQKKLLCAVVADAVCGCLLAVVGDVGDAGCCSDADVAAVVEAVIGSRCCCCW